MLSVWALNNHAELDGYLALTGSPRLNSLPYDRALNLVYQHLTKDTDMKGRKYLDDALAGRIGSAGGLIIDDPKLPASLQGKEAPSWFSENHDPYAEAKRVG